MEQSQFEKLILENEKFVYSIVHKEFNNYAWDIKEDLFSAGKEGLVVAASKYKPDEFTKNKFTTYAQHWIKYYINEEIRNLYPIKLDQNYSYKKNKIKKFIKNFEEKHSKTPTVVEISKGTGFSKKVIENTLNVNSGLDFTYTSIDSFKNNDTDDSTNNNCKENAISHYVYIDQAIETQPTDRLDTEFLLEHLKKNVSKEHFDMFYDKHFNDYSYTDIAKKYNLNFAASAKYIIEKVEKICKQFLQNEKI